MDFFTSRSSPEWNVRIAALPPGARASGSFSMNASQNLAYSLFTSIRSAWKVRAQDFDGFFFSVFEENPVLPAGSGSRSANVVSIFFPFRSARVTTWEISFAYGSSAFSMSMPSSSSRATVRRRSAAEIPASGFRRKIQRSIIFVGKAALRIINLHGGNTKIRQNEVKGAVFGSNLINIGKILMKNR